MVECCSGTPETHYSKIPSLHYSIFLRGSCHVLHAHRQFARRGDKLAETGRRVSVLWQHEDTLVFLARGREYRSEFHINPSDETMHMIKGDMRLHYRTPEGKEEVARDPGRRDHLHARRHAPFAALPAKMPSR